MPTAFRYPPTGRRARLVKAARKLGIELMPRQDIAQKFIDGLTEGDPTAKRFVAETYHGDLGARKARELVEKAHADGIDTVEDTPIRYGSSSPSSWPTPRAATTAPTTAPNSSTLVPAFEPTPAHRGLQRLRADYDYRVQAGTSASTCCRGIAAATAFSRLYPESRYSSPKAPLILALELARRLSPRRPTLATGKPAK